jgi:predicted dehydrogenase
MSESSPNGKTIRCGVVGVGRMGRHHARVYTELPGATLVGVVDQDAQRRADIVSKHGGKAFGSVEQLLDEGVDAVSIAVPTTAHLESATPLLEAGVACLIEKPLANTVEEAEKIAALASKSGATLQVGHIERYNPAVMALRKLQHSGAAEIAPRFIEIHRVSPMTFRSVDVGVVLDMMIHDIDVVLMLMGGREPREVRAAAVSVITPHEDVCNARLEFDTPRGVCVANITASRLAMKTERKIRIIAEDAYVSIDYGKREGIVIRKTANEDQLAMVQKQIREGKDLSDLNYGELIDVEPLKIDEAEPLKSQLSSFLDAVRTGRKPDIDARDGFANVRTAQRIVEAASKNR